MAQLSDDCFAFGGELMAAERALEILESRLSTVTGTERVALRAACGRILAEDVTADRDVPPSDNAAVDGFAVFFDDLDPAAPTRLPVAGRIAAGHPLDRAARRGSAYRIFTGAPIPPGPPGTDGTAESGPDTVLMQEDCRIDGDHVVVPPRIARGANRRRRGEDVTTGTVVLHRGRWLRPQDVALAAATGRSALTVHARLRAAVFSTGDEVRDPGAPLPEGCLYDSNRYALLALLEGLGARVTDLGILPDRFEAVREALADAAREHDLLVTSGGVSTGDEDHVRAAVEALGSLQFWRLAIKPGRPIAFGLLRRPQGREKDQEKGRDQGQDHGRDQEQEKSGVAFIGLPGNPVAVMVTFLRLARPAILKMAGATQVSPRLYRVPADFTHHKKAGRREWVRACLARDGAGHLIARKHPKQGSGVLTSVVEADGLVEIGEDVTEIGAGDLVDFLPFSEVGA